MFYHYTGFCIYLGILYLLPLGSPSWVSDWAFAESGCTFAHWEPGLIPLNKICSKKTFLNKIKQAKKKKKQVYWFISYCLKLYKAMNPAELHFSLLRQCEMLKVAWVYYYLFFFTLRETNVYFCHFACLFLICYIFYCVWYYN